MRQWLLILFTSMFFGCSTQVSSVDTTHYVQITNYGSDTHSVSFVSDDGDATAISNLSNEGTVSEPVAIKHNIQYTIYLNSESTNLTMNGLSVDYIEFVLSVSNEPQYISTFKIDNNDNFRLDY